MISVGSRFWAFLSFSLVAGANTTLAADIVLDRDNKTLMCAPDFRDGGRHHANRTVYVDLERAKRILRNKGYVGPCAIYGDKRSLGGGYFRSYVQLKPDGTPWGIGLEFPKPTLTDLPTIRHDGISCFDINGNGTLEMDGGPGIKPECANGHELALDLPAKEAVQPFKFALVNWQPFGHGPAGIYNVGHFDFHFYSQSYVDRNLIRVGPCAIVTNCDDVDTARKPVPAIYMHPDFVDQGAVATRMGNHLLDMTAPEYHGVPFTEAFVWGVYDGKVTFWEPVVSKAYLETGPSMCSNIKQPLAYQESGHYPTKYCIRYRAERQDYTVSLEGFVYHEAQ